jgi:PIN domain nuclease of toxin-antitoxin system
MRLLLDTHAVLWFWWDDPRLSARARAAIADPANEKFVSIATPWEVAIKVSLGKLDIGGPYAGFFREFMPRSAFEWMPLDDRHFERLTDLPFLHRDPFDRLLVSQALVEGIALVSREQVFDAYGVERIWRDTT